MTFCKVPIFIIKLQILYLRHIKLFIYLNRYIHSFIDFMKHYYYYYDDDGGDDGDGDDDDDGDVFVLDSLSYYIHHFQKFI